MRSTVAPPVGWADRFLSYKMHPISALSHFSIQLYYFAYQNSPIAASFFPLSVNQRTNYIGDLSTLIRRLEKNRVIR